MRIETGRNVVYYKAVLIMNSKDNVKDTRQTPSCFTLQHVLKKPELTGHV